MAKRKAKAHTRKAARKTKTKSAARPRASSRPARRAKTVRPARKPARPRAKGASASARRASANTPARKARKPTAGRPKPAGLNRERRRLREDETVRGVPSQLGFASKASGAESGQAMYHQRIREHTEGGSALTGGDIDTDWGDAYASGEQTPGGDMPTPDQDVVEEIGRALGVEYEDSEELKGADKIEERDKHRWEYDPASAEDYKDRTRKEE